jgi:putative transposase
MSGVGQYWYNAPMENFFASLIKEFVHHEDYEIREEEKTGQFEYVEVFYNN